MNLLTVSTVIWLSGVPVTTSQGDYRWVLSRPGEVVKAQTGALGDPAASSFTTTLCDLVPVCDLTSAGADSVPFYVCPDEGPSYCNNSAQYYCPYWGCETIAPLWIEGAGKDPDIKMEYYPPGCVPPRPYGTWRAVGSGRLSNYRVQPSKLCKQVQINVTTPNNTNWNYGKSWGLRYYQDGTDLGGIFSIQRFPVEALSAAGPNKVLAPPKRNKNHKLVSWTTERPLVSGPSALSYGPPLSYSSPVFPTNASDSLPPAGVPDVGLDSHPLWTLLSAMYQVLNVTNPNETRSCWLCYEMRLPFYEAVGITGNYSVSPNSQGCQREQKAPAGLTVPSVTGKGLCVGQVNDSNPLCSRSEPIREGYYLPPNNSWWACSESGLTPCFSGQLASQAREYCIMVQVLPRILYHPGDQLLNDIESDHQLRRKREPRTATTVASLLGPRLAGSGTGIASLAQQSHPFSNLRWATHGERERLDTAVSRLERSLSSLAEVASRKRQGSAPPFPGQGALCAALGEECCVYADHTGVVRDSMKKLRERLDKRERELEQQGWFASWFSLSPWLAAAVCSFFGLLLILLLLLAVRQCVLNQETASARDRVHVVHLGVL
uniref:Uncharacterized protein n=1 Tax=Oryctolagus cuniculus TaxID=9986 RepID=U3KMW6_RABIT